MKVTHDIKYIGVNDRNIDLFEGQYIVPNGMAYNSYAIRHSVPKSPIILSFSIWSPTTVQASTSL